MYTKKPMLIKSCLEVSSVSQARIQFGKEIKSEDDLNNVYAEKENGTNVFACQA